MFSIWTKIFFSQIAICALSILIYEILNCKISVHIFLNKKPYFEPVENEFYSSVSCRGSSHINRVCFFKNLCYHPPIKEFIVFHSYKSVLDGVPKDRFTPALIDFSSVNDHNTQYFNYIDLPFYVSSNFSIDFKNGTSLIFKRFNPENLMHVFHDDLIPAFVTLNEISTIGKDTVQFVFADGRNPGPYSFLYENFLNNKPLYLNASLTNTLCFESAIVGLNKNSLWYQYGFNQPQGSLDKNLSKVYPHITNFCSYFLKHFNIKTSLSDPLSAVLLSRENNRKILNIENVAELIKKKLHTNVKVISLEKISVIAIIQEIIKCKIMVGIHGSLLILSIFLPQHSYLIELFPYAIKPDISTPYKTLANITGIKYQSWENKIKNNSFPHPEYPAELGGILHLSKEEQESIKKSSVKPFLCCYNPQWLYRIYQDTIVDLNSLSEIIDKVLKQNYTKMSNNNLVQRLYPSEVRNISCNLSSTGYFYILWEPPWNILFLNNSILEYELWYQNGNNDAKAFIMKKNYFIFKEVVPSSIYIWVRCHFNNKIGSFNSDPLICLKTK